MAYACSWISSSTTPRSSMRGSRSQSPHSITQSVTGTSGGKGRLDLTARSCHPTTGNPCSRVVPGYTTKQQMSGIFISSQAPSLTSIGRTMKYVRQSTWISISGSGKESRFSNGHHQFNIETDGLPRRASRARSV